MHPPLVLLPLAGVAPLERLVDGANPLEPTIDGVDPLEPCVAGLFLGAEPRVVVFQLLAGVV